MWRLAQADLPQIRAAAMAARGVNIMRINTKYNKNAYYPKYC